MAADSQNPIVVTRTRGGYPETQHRGAFAVYEGGCCLRRHGDVGQLSFVRSGAKFFQALSAVRAARSLGVDLQRDSLAVLCASHSGEARHLAAVERILAAASAGVEDLDCGAHPPMARAARKQLQGRPSSLHNNCSGKHAGMLLAARAAEAPLLGYLQREHPIQRRILADLATLADLEEDTIGVAVDGCSAPTFLLPLEATARAFSRFGRTGDPQLDDPAKLLIEAVAADGFFLGGSERFDSDLVRATQGRLFSKVGAEGFYALFEPRAGRALALHLDDGDIPLAARLAATLALRLGWLQEDEFAALGKHVDPVLKNHAGRVVGSVEVAAF